MKRVKLLILLFITSFIYKTDGQSRYFQGTWTKINTSYLFEFDLTLDHAKDGTVNGVFFWTVRAFDKNSSLSRDHYKDRLGLTAKEFVKGRYNKDSREYHLTGYKKEDPHQIIGLDTYVIKLESEGVIHGKTKANNSWKGRIKGKEQESFAILTKDFQRH